MQQEPYKRPQRQPLTFEEVNKLIKLKRMRKAYQTAQFKKTKQFKIFNVFNVVAVLIYTEIIFSFLNPCNFSNHYVQTITPYFGEKVKGNTRVFSHAVLVTLSGKEYDVSIQDTCTLPKVSEKILIGYDWVLHKAIKVRFGNFTKDFFIQKSFSLLFISILCGILTFVLFGYNMNEVPHSLDVITLANALSVFAFLMY